MNQEQVKSAIRWGVTAFGGIFAGYIAGKGWASANDILGVVQSDTFIQGVSAVITLGGLVWGLFAHKEKNVIAAANNMPNVAGVITKDTVAGQDLAKSVPSSGVTAAGTAKAASIAKAR